MPSNIRSRLVNRTIIVVFTLELVILAIWSQFFMRRPFGSVLIQPVMDVSGEVGQVVFGCQSLACIPFVFAGVVLYLYVVAILIGNVYLWKLADIPISPLQ